VPIKFTPWFLISVGLVDLLFLNRQPQMLALGFLFIAWGGLLLLLPYMRKPAAKGPVVRVVARQAPSAFLAPKPVAEELAKLGILRERGVITEAEFETQKKKLLG
jgi:hypothetical protein